MEMPAETSLVDRFDWLVDWLYPPRCRACGGRIHGRDAEYFCAGCWQHIQLITHPLCHLCGRPFPDASGDDHTCGVCLSRAPQFVAARAWACYPRDEIEEHPLRQVVQKFKYGRRVSLGKPLGRLMARGCQEFLGACPVDLIIPVPLHHDRERERGFNQACVLARELSRLGRLPIDEHSVVRRVHTERHRAGMDAKARRQSVANAFTVRHPKSIAGKRVLLIDDVFTTGATVSACAEVLKGAGAEEVFVLTVARV